MVSVLSSFSFFKPSPEKLVRQLKDLPPTPKVLHRLQKLVKSPDSTLDDIGELIAMEPGLAARVVRIANSTHFGGHSQVSDIVEAIQRVGLNGVHEVVTFALASQVVGQPLDAYGLDANSLWFRAIACALAASSLSANNGLDRGEAYTAGLLHGLGLMVINKHVSQTKATLRFDSVGYPLDFAPSENAFLGFSHAEAGAALLELWGFSPAVICAVRYQLNPEAAPEHRPLCMTLATARWARSLFCVPEEKIPELPPENWLDEAGLRIGDFGAWLSEVRQGYNLAKIELRLG
jgi:HD-like signal output (HDOD) protein